MYLLSRKLSDPKQTSYEICSPLASASHKTLVLRFAFLDSTALGIRGQFKRDGTRAETRFRLSAK